MSEMDLETAERVIAEHRDRRRAQEAEANKVYIGRFFKYRNTYGGSEPESWWLYASVTSVDDWGGLFGVSFQHMADDRVEVHLKDRVSHIVSANIEISADEFWSAARGILGSVSRALLPES
jgi:hypothetical protein